MSSTAKLYLSIPSDANRSYPPLFPEEGKEEEESEEEEYKSNEGSESESESEESEESVDLDDDARFKAMSAAELDDEIDDQNEKIYIRERLTRDMYSEFIENDENGGDRDIGGAVEIIEDYLKDDRKTLALMVKHLQEKEEKRANRKRPLPLDSVNDLGKGDESDEEKEENT